MCEQEPVLYFDDQLELEVDEDALAVGGVLEAQEEADVEAHLVAGLGLAVDVLPEAHALAHLLAIHLRRAVRVFRLATQLVRLVRLDAHFKIWCPLNTTHRQLTKT